MSVLGSPERVWFRTADFSSVAQRAYRDCCVCLSVVVSGMISFLLRPVFTACIESGRALNVWVAVLAAALSYPEGP